MKKIIILTLLISTSLFARVPKCDDEAVIKSIKRQLQEVIVKDNPEALNLINFRIEDITTVIKEDDAIFCMANMIMKLKGFDNKTYDDYFTYSARYNKFNQIVVKIDD